MLAKLIIFMVDLTLALATFGLLYAVSLLATTSIFIFVLFYLFKGMDKHCDFSKGRVRMLDSSSAAGKAFAGDMGRVSSRTKSGNPTCVIFSPKHWLGTGQK
uniref:Uncharacterized protein n=1 Tax=Ailuropoda melanoleuca TaxID=9646 RepID=A0A7N5P8W7_AILME